MPNVVKGSKQHRMVVVPYRPGYRLAVSLLLGALLLGALYGAYFVGEYSASRRFSVDEQDNQRLQLILNDSQAQLVQLRAQLAEVGRTSALDQRATIEVQSTLTKLRQRVTQLEQDVAFYRQVMSPEVDKPGVIVAELSVQPTATPRVYRYKAVFRQAGTGDAMLDGDASISLLGLVDGEEATLIVEDLYQGSEGFQGKLRFRYFQNLEGEMLIPESFSPSQVVVEATSQSPAQSSMSRMFNWTYSEG